jgi:hypothetical protein
VLCLTSWKNDPTSTIPASTIAALLDRGFGADLAATDMYGWNTFFHFVLRTRSPCSGAELQAARILLPVMGNILAEDRDGHTLFDHVKRNRPALPQEHEAAVLELSMDVRSLKRYGSYQQDLLYCALLRSGLYSLRDLPPLPAGPRFTRKYTPQHYRALLYLQTWDKEADPTVLTHPLLSRGPLCDTERRHAPAFLDWDAWELETMEERLKFATFKRRKRTHGRSKKRSSESALAGCSDGLGGKIFEALDNDLFDLPASRNSEELEKDCLKVALEENRELGSVASVWSNDSEEEGGVSV